MFTNYTKYRDEIIRTIISSQIDARMITEVEVLGSEVETVPSASEFFGSALNLRDDNSALVYCV
jgi:hypothetical protein